MSLEQRQTVSHYELLVTSRVDSLIISQTLYSLAYFALIKQLTEFQLVHYGMPIIITLLCQFDLLYCTVLSTHVVKLKINLKIGNFISYNLLRSALYPTLFVIYWCFISLDVQLGSAWAIFFGNCVFSAAMLLLGLVLGWVLV